MYFSGKKVQQLNIPRGGGGDICPSSKIVYEISFNFTWQNVFDMEARCNKYL